jgi:hypothetical protein
MPAKEEPFFRHAKIFLQKPMLLRCAAAALIAL